MAAAPPIVYGINAYLPPDQTANLNRQKALGNVPVRRLFIFWSMVQPDGPDQWQWDSFDQQYHAILDAGLKVEITLHNSPCWASPTTTCEATHSAPGLPDPSFAPQWQNFVTAAAQRYPLATAIEIWNEPNLSRIDPVAYTLALKVAYRAVKAVAPAMPVISSGLSANLTGSGNWESYLKAMLKAGAAQYMDGLGLHTYPVVASLGQLFWSAQQFGPILDATEAIQSRAGVHKPLWITEAGCGATADNSVWRGITPIQQATDCVAMMKIAANRGDVRAMYIDTLDDVAPEYGYGWVGALGLYNPDGTPKPAACAISTLLGGTLAC